MATAIIVGASSGIGRHLAELLGSEGYALGLVARREELLRQLSWVATPAKAARQIYDAIRAKKRHAYVTRRWRLVAWALKLMPARLLARL